MEVGHVEVEQGLVGQEVLAEPLLIEQVVALVEDEGEQMDAE